AGVGVRGLVSMAALANGRAGIGEPCRFVTVTVLAGHRRLADVLLVPGARAKLRPRSRNDAGGDEPGSLRHGAKKRHQAASDEKQHRRSEPEERLSRRRHQPPPWHRRQGRSRSLSLLLEKWRPCGLPPGPPTR